MERVVLWAAAEEERLLNLERLKRKSLRATSEPMTLPEKSFIDNFRVSKDEFRTLCADLHPYLQPSHRSTAVHPEIRVLAALQYYSFGGCQRGVGNDYKLGLAQQTVSDSLAEVTNALNHPTILRKYIKFPQTEAERVEVCRGFHDKFRFPGVLGCIDGTHVAIIRPSANEEAYFNRKYFHSLNAMVVCDANLRILYCDASFGGASHDSHIWNSSPLKRLMVDLHEQGHSYWFLGDSGYAQRPWMMTPILHADPNTPEAFYTTRHIAARNVVERCFGVLKSRFRCLFAHRMMHYDPVKAAKMFNACVVLHNLINDPTFPVLQVEIDNDAAQQPPLNPLPQDVRDRGRTDVVERLWRNRHRRN